MAGLVINVNGKPHAVEAPADTPLLYVLRNELGLNGPLFGCGLEQCGACKVLRGAEAVASCRLPVGEVAGDQITTLEGLGTPDEPHPVQQAFLLEQAAQCGYCSNGMMITAAALIWRTPHPTDAQIRAALDDNLCRCGSHQRIIRAVKRAAALLWDDEEGAE
ncbi:MAG: (2Fe-2S)-binding protein [Chloroflexota bacterium]|nr:(2Fe-2S)-binding protein [Chloroflexota bacterium]